MNSYVKKKWIVDKMTGRYVACEDRISHFFICPSAPTVFYTIDGRRIRGIPRSDGEMCGYRVLPYNPDYKKKNRFY